MTQHSVTHPTSLRQLKPCSKQGCGGEMELIGTHQCRFGDSGGKTVFMWICMKCHGIEQEPCLQAASEDDTQELPVVARPMWVD